MNFVKRSLEPTDLKLAGKLGLITAILAFDKGLGPDLRNELW
jgi:DNA-directed RNA polymerase sigma subunit (sigma70/sigma32)